MRRAGAVAGGLLLAIVLFSGAGAAEDQWKYVGANQKGERLFYDASSVMYMSSDLIQVWTKEEAGLGTMKKHKEINCSYKIIRDLYVIYEGKQMPPVLSHVPSDWQAMEQDPVTKELYKILCR